MPKKSKAVAEYQSQLGRRGGQAKSTAKTAANRQKSIDYWTKQKSSSKSLESNDLQKSE
jgi:hypothetical protein